MFELTFSVSCGHYTEIKDTWVLMCGPGVFLTVPLVDRARDYRS